MLCATSVNIPSIIKLGYAKGEGAQGKSEWS